MDPSAEEPSVGHLVASDKFAVEPAGRYAACGLVRAGLRASAAAVAASGSKSARSTSCLGAAVARFTACRRPVGGDASSDH